MITFLRPDIGGVKIGRRREMAIPLITIKPRFNKKGDPEGIEPPNAGKEEVKKGGEKEDRHNGKVCSARSIERKWRRIVCSKTPFTPELCGHESALTHVGIDLEEDKEVQIMAAGKKNTGTVSWTEHRRAIREKVLIKR